MKSAYLHFIPCRIFLSSFALCITSSFFETIGPVDFRVFLQNHNTELSRNVYATTTDIQSVGERVHLVRYFTKYFVFT